MQNRLNNKFVSFILSFLFILSVFPAQQLNAGAEAYCARVISSGGETDHESLAEALQSAQNGDTVILLCDSETDESFNVSGKNVTLDLSGCTLTLTGEAQIRASGMNGGIITVCDSSYAPGSIVYEGDEACVYVGNHSQVTLSNGVSILCPAGGNGVHITSGADLTVNDAVIETSGNGAPFDFSRGSMTPVSVKIYNGVFTSDGTVFSGYGHPDVNVYGGVFDSDGLIAPAEDPEYYPFSVNLSVEGGWFRCDPEEYASAVGSDYKTEAGQGDMAGYTHIVDRLFVAQVGQTKYEQITPAVNAAGDGDTVILLCDSETDESFNVSGKSVTLDLNGCTLTLTGEAQIRASGMNGGIITVCDSSSAPGSIVYEGEEACVFVGNHSQVTLSNGVSILCPAGGNGVHITSGADLTVNDAVIETSGNGSPFDFSRGSMTPVSVRIYDGVFTSDGAVFSGYGHPDVNVYGGVFDSDGLIAPAEDPEYYPFSVNLSVEGGWFRCDPEEYASAVSSDYKAEAGQGDMAGYTHIVERLFVAQVGQTKYELIMPAVYAAGNDETLVLLTDISDIVTIYIGHTLHVAKNGHSLDVRLYESERSGSYAVTERSEGELTVYSSIPAYEVGSAHYDSLTAAMNAVGEGGTVRLLGDVEFNHEPDYESDYPDFSINMPVKTFTIDLNGHSFDSEFRLLQWNGGNVTFTDTSDGGTGAFCGCITGFEGNMVFNGGLLDCISDYGTSLNVYGSNVEITGETKVVMRSWWLDFCEGSFLVTGGYFSADPSSYITSDYKVLDPAHSGLEGFYGVARKNVAAIVGEDKYESFEEAALAANGDVIILAADIPGVYLLCAGQTLTVLLNGHALTVLPADEGYGLSASPTEAVVDGQTVTVVVYTSFFPVARIGETEFGSVKSAVTAAQSGDTVILLCNSETDESFNVSGKSVTLDLNGCTLTMTREAQIRASGMNGGIITVCDSSSAPGSIVYEGEEACVYVGNHSQVTLTGGVSILCPAGGNAVHITSGADLTVNDAVIETSGNGSPFDFSRGSMTPVSVRIYDGVFTSDGTVFSGYGHPDVNVYGGVFDSDGLIAPAEDPEYYPFSVNLSVEGGWFRCDPEEYASAVGSDYKAEAGQGDMAGYTHIVERLFVAKVGQTKYEDFSQAVESANGEAILLLANVGEYALSSPEQTLRVILDGHTLSVLPPAGCILITTLDDGVTLFASRIAEATVNGVDYLSFTEAAAAANGAVITLNTNVSEAYILHAGAEIRVRKGAFSLTVQAGSDEDDEGYALQTSVSGDVTVYTSTLCEAWVNGTYYMHFADAVQAAGSTYTVCLLKDVAEPYRMTGPDQRFTVARNYYSLTVLQPNDTSNGEEKWAIVTTALEDGQAPPANEQSNSADAPLLRAARPTHAVRYVHRRFTDQIYFRAARAFVQLIKSGGGEPVNYTSIDSAVLNAGSGDALATLAPIASVGVPAGMTFGITLDSDEKFILFCGSIVILANIIESVAVELNPREAPVDIFCHYNSDQTDGWDKGGVWNGYVDEKHRTAPERAGHKFVGWFYDAAFTDAFDINAQLTGELFAKYAKNIDKDGFRSAYSIEIYAKWDPYLAQVGSSYYDTLSEAVAAANGGVIILQKDAPTAYQLSQNERLVIKKNGHLLTVNAPAGFTTDEQTGDDGTTVYTVSGGVAMVGTTRYLSFASAVQAANGSDISLLADIPEPYTLNPGQTISVIRNSRALTVNAPAGGYALNESSEQITSGSQTFTRTVYSVVRLLTVTLKFGGALEDLVFSVREGAAFERPAAEVLQGRACFGWFTDENCTQTYDFSAPVTANLILFTRLLTRGDVNGDGIVDIADITALLNIISGNGVITDVCDVNGNGTVDIDDVSALLNILAGIF